MTVFWRSYYLMLKARDAVTTFVQMVVGYQFLAVIVFGLLVPLSPLLAILFVLKRLEQVCFSWLYNATLVIPNKPDQQNRVILVVVNGLIPLDKLQECFVQNVIDSHNVNGNLSFPNVTRALKASWLNTYWMDENRFCISSHIQLLSDELHTFQDIPMLLNRTQQTKYEDVKGNALSPWLIKIYYMDKDQSAIFFRIDPLLDDESAIMRALFSDIKYKEINVFDDNLTSVRSQDNSSFTNLFKHGGLAGWLLLRTVFTFTKNKFNLKKHITTKNSTIGNYC